jgi:uncharacterized protein (TIGR02145 family)
MMKALLFTIFIGLFLLSCGTENKPTYKVTFTISPMNSGTITLTPSGGVYSKGDIVNVTANPTSDGWRFVRWEGDWSGETNPFTLTLTKDYTIIGVFEKRDYTLTVNIEGNGFVEERVIHPKTTQHPYQTVVELTPIPVNGWRFVEWSGDLTGSEAPKQISVDREKVVTAKFERRNYPLTITTVGEGTVKETVLPQKTTEYPYETVVVLEPLPSVGWEFVSWGGDISGNTVPQMLIVNDAKDVKATFQLKTYPVNVSVEGNGTITVEPQQDLYPHFSTIVLTPNPPEGWEFVSWGGDVSGNTVPLEVTVTNEVNIKGIFGRKDYPLTVNVLGEGSVLERIIPQRTTQYPFETMVELTSKPEDGWVFYRWIGDLTGSENPKNIQVNNSKTVTSEFKSIDDLLTVESIGQGTVQIRQETFETNPSRRRLTLIPLPSVGWAFIKWGGDLSGDEVLKQLVIDDEKKITVTFQLNTYRDMKTLVVDVFNPKTGRTWMDRNLGASRVATSSTDLQAFGDLYQWGRRADNHQYRYSPTITTLSSNDTPPHGRFILVQNIPYDWRTPQNNNLWQGLNGVNNPCPLGYRLPTSEEWHKEISSWSSENTAGAFASPLRLPSSGDRNLSDGSLGNFGIFGNYWSSSLVVGNAWYYDGISAWSMFFNFNNAGTYNSHRARGGAIRCIKN